MRPRTPLWIGHVTNVLLSINFIEEVFEKSESLFLINDVVLKQLRLGYDYLIYYSKHVYIQ